MSRMAKKKYSKRATPARLAEVEKKYPEKQETYLKMGVRGGEYGAGVYIDGQSIRPGYNRDGTKRKERRGKSAYNSKHRVVYNPNSKTPYVYNGIGDYLGTYYNYRMSHPGNYTQIISKDMKQVLTRKQKDYLRWCDQEAEKHKNKPKKT